MECLAGFILCTTLPDGQSATSMLSLHLYSEMNLAIQGTRDRATSSSRILGIAFVGQFFWDFIWSFRQLMTDVDGMSEDNHLTNYITLLWYAPASIQVEDRGNNASSFVQKVQEMLAEEVKKTEFVQKVQEMLEEQEYNCQDLDEPKNESNIT
ncbi:hypothetical protein ACJX0J_032651, partial [Zea mays]